MPELLYESTAKPLRIAGLLDVLGFYCIAFFKEKNLSQILSKFGAPCFPRVFIVLGMVPMKGFI